MTMDKDTITRNAVLAAMKVIDDAVQVEKLSSSPIGDKLAYDLDKRIRSALNDVDPTYQPETVTRARREAFKEATKGITPYQIAIRLQVFRTGVDWRGCKKFMMEDDFAIADGRLRHVTTDQLRKAMKLQ